MSACAEAIRLRLAQGPASARQLIDFIGLSQPTLWRALTELGPSVVRMGAARSIQYALRDERRGVADISIYRVATSGQLDPLGTLVPVLPEGFVMFEETGKTLHSPGLPWWLHDMRPQGYLGRAYVARHARPLGLPERLADWTDSHTLRALLVHGHDLVGNLLLGDLARDRFLSMPLPPPVADEDKPAAYVRLAREAALGEHPGSSAAGEQPKFMSYAMTPDGPRHVLVKFSETEAGPVSERWRDLLLAEHIALQTLAEGGVQAARSRVLDHEGQRFLEVERFDRVGELGRLALHSLEALGAEFVGSGNGHWPSIVRRLAAARQVRPEAVHGTGLLWAFGTLIGNTDMHNGNLSFIAGHGRPYALAPAYDMSCMGFRPTGSGRLQDALAAALICAEVSHAAWREALALANDFLRRVKAEQRFSARFAPCIAALQAHLEVASQTVGRLG